MVFVCWCPIDGSPGHCVLQRGHRGPCAPKHGDLDAAQVEHVLDLLCDMGRFMRAIGDAWRYEHGEG